MNDYTIHLQKIPPASKVDKPEVIFGCSIGEGTAFIGNEHGAQKLLKTINKFDGIYSKYTVIFADTLYSHNIPDGSDFQKNNQAKEMLDAWLNKNNFSIKNDKLYYGENCLTLKGTVVRWDAFRNDNKHKQILEDMYELYNLNVETCNDSLKIEKHNIFYEGVNKTLEERKKSFNKQNKSVKDSKIIDYLLEEYSVLINEAKTKKVNVFHYPSDEPDGLKAARKCFLDDPTLLNFSKITIGSKSKKLKKSKEKKGRREEKIRLKNEFINENDKGKNQPKSPTIPIPPLKHNTSLSFLNNNDHFNKQINPYENYPTQKFELFSNDCEIEDLSIHPDFLNLFCLLDGSFNDALKKYPNNFGTFADALIMMVKKIEEKCTKETNPKVLSKVITDLYANKTLEELNPILKNALKTNSFSGSPSSPKGEMSFMLLIGYLKSNMQAVCLHIISLLNKKDIKVSTVVDILKLAQKNLINNSKNVYELEEQFLILQQNQNTECKEPKKNLNKYYFKQNIYNNKQYLEEPKNKIIIYD